MIGCVGRSHWVQRIRDGFFGGSFLNRIYQIRIKLNEYTHTHTHIYRCSNQLHACRYTSAHPKHTCVSVCDGVTSYANGKQWPKEAHRKIGRLNSMYINVNLYWFLSLFLYLGCVFFFRHRRLFGVTHVQDQKLTIDLVVSIVSKYRAVHQSFVVVAAHVRTDLRHTMLYEM